MKITSRDPISNDVIRQNAEGSSPRPYILINSGTTNISNSEIVFLGLASNPLKYGISFQFSGKEGSTLTNNTFHDMPAGFFSDSVGFTTIKNNKYSDNNFGIAIYHSSNGNIYNNLLKSNNVAVYICCWRMWLETL